MASKYKDTKTELIPNIVPDYVDPITKFTNGYKTLEITMDDKYKKEFPVFFYSIKLLDFSNFSLTLIIIFIFMLALNKLTIFVIPIIEFIFKSDKLPLTLFIYFASIDFLGLVATIHNLKWWYCTKDISFSYKFVFTFQTFLTIGCWCFISYLGYQSSVFLMKIIEDFISLDYSDKKAWIITVTKLIVYAIENFKL